MVSWFLNACERCWQMHRAALDAEVEEVGEAVRLEPMIDGGRGQICGARDVEGEEHLLTLRRGGFEEPETVAVMHVHPGVVHGALAARRFEKADDELGGEAQFDQFSPCPQSVVFAIAGAVGFELERVHPAVAPVAAFLVRHVMAGGEPRAEFLQAGNTRCAHAREIAAPVSRCGLEEPRPVDGRRDAGPRIGGRAQGKLPAAQAAPPTERTGVGPRRHRRRLAHAGSGGTNSAASAAEFMR